MRFCIHRGTQEIGGTCVEVESQGKRIVLDIGLPLDDNVEADTMPLHPVPGFDVADPSLLGVVISHPHLDHYGLAHRLLPETRFLIGEAAQAILEAADFFTPSGLKLQNVTHLVDRQPISIGPFTITPFEVDHSAYDSYALLIEADGKKLFYSGDFRAHGRKAGLVEKLIADPPDNVDILLIEGTTLGRNQANERFPTEDELVPQFEELLSQTEGLTLVWASGQNIDRLTTLYQACRNINKQLIIDVYTAHILLATGDRETPQFDRDGMRVFLPKTQKWRIKNQKAFEKVAPFYPKRIYPEDFSEAADQSVMLFRPSMQREINDIHGLPIGQLIVSVWKGYLNDERNRPMIDWLSSRNIALNTCHTSGHAHHTDLLRFRQAFVGALAVPIHLHDISHATELYQPCLRLNDHVWKNVAT